MMSAVPGSAMLALRFSGTCPAVADAACGAYSTHHFSSPSRSARTARALTRSEMCGLGAV